MDFLQYSINGISIGAVYAIIALGYTMVYDLQDDGSNNRHRQS